MTSYILPTDHTLGHTKAPVELICYGDYLCPLSRELHFTVSQLLQDFEGKVWYAFRPFPRPQRHAYALLASLAAEAAGLQGNYWPMHYALFRYREGVDRNTIYDLAIALGLNLKAFHQNLLEGNQIECILQSLEKGRQHGVRSTPALFINGEQQEHISLWLLQERLERWLTNFPDQEKPVPATVRLLGKG